jgi:hypothetical protein
LTEQNLKKIIEELKIFSKERLEEAGKCVDEYEAATLQGEGQGVLASIRRLEAWQNELRNEPWKIYTVTERDTVMKVLKYVLGEKE